MSWIVKLMNYLLTLVTIGSKNSLRSLPLNSSDDGYYVWNKGEKVSLSPFFSSSEMSCHCTYPTCIKQRISKSLIEKLGTVRKEIGQPLVVTSAFRCPEYQAHLVATGVNTVVAKLSQHELGNAADVEPKDGKMEGFEEVCSKQFESIGLAKNFLHLDLRMGHRRWNY